MLYVGKWVEKTTWLYDVPNNKVYKILVYLNGLYNFGKRRNDTDDKDLISLWVE